MAIQKCLSEPAPALAFLDAILESSDDAIVGETADGTIVSWNKAAETLYGYQATEVIGRPASLLTAGRTEPGANMVCTETVHFRKDGSPIPISLTTSPIRNDAGEVTGRVAIARGLAQRRCPLGRPDCEGRFRSLFDANPVPMWVYDCETLRYLEINHAAIVHYGYSRAEFLKKRITDLHPPEDLSRVIELLKQDRPTIRQSGPWRHLHQNGTIIDVELASHLTDWRGRRAALVVAYDISERKRAAESLRASEERFRTAFEDAPFGMCLSSLDGRFLQVNAALCQLLGYSREELVGTGWMTITHPEDGERSTQAVEQLKCRVVNSVEFEKRYICRNGNTIWLRLRVSVVNGADGSVLHFITHIEDITARRQAERALQESEEKYRSLIAHIPDVLWVADAAGRVVFVSPNGERLIGIGLEEVYRRGTCALLEVVHPDDRQGVTDAFRMLFEGDQTYDVEFRVRGQSGEWIWVHDRAVAAYEKDGVRHASGLRSDIGERRRAEAALRARDAAEDANRTKSAFLANMSHELRTPLNAIIGYSQMLQEDCSAAEQCEIHADLEKIERSGQILLGIINDVLDLSKIEAGRMEVRLQNVNVAAVLEDVLTTVAPLARQQGNSISLDCPVEARRVWADLPKLRQCLLNLVNNACKFTENGSISVAVRRVPGSPDWTEVRVSDTGIGIRPEHLNKLFQPFTQLDDSSTRKYNGTGLGLAICKRFCQMMGAAIAVESTPGRGSCFTLRLQVPHAPAAAT